MILRDLTGQVFGRFTVIERAEDYISPGGVRFTRWLCRCECGQIRRVTVSNLKSRPTVSCGCWMRERLTRQNARGTVGYEGAHWRVKVQRGWATEHICVDCAGPAAEWSYVGACEEERMRVVKGREQPFCLHPEHYAPRCVSCHRKYDRQRTGGRTDPVR